jgi:hypothetical protein
LGEAKRNKRARRNRRLVVGLDWQDGAWGGKAVMLSSLDQVAAQSRLDAARSFTVSRDDLLNGNFFRRWDRPGTLITKESVLLSVYDDGEQQQLDAQTRQAGWEIRVLSDEQASEAEAEHQARRNLWNHSEPFLDYRDSLKEENVHYDDDDLVFALEQALEYPKFDMVMVQAADSGRGCFFGHPDRVKSPIKNKANGCLTCATDEQMLMLQEKYRHFLLGRDFVDSRCGSN